MSDSEQYSVINLFVTNFTINADFPTCRSPIRTSFILWVGFGIRFIIMLLLRSIFEGFFIWKRHSIWYFYVTGVGWRIYRSQNQQIHIFENFGITWHVLKCIFLTVLKIFYSKKFSIWKFSVVTAMALVSDNYLGSKIKEFKDMQPRW